jgi:hypothetical protein
MDGRRTIKSGKIKSKEKVNFKDFKSFISGSKGIRVPALKV